MKDRRSRTGAPHRSFLIAAKAMRDRAVEFKEVRIAQLQAAWNSARTVVGSGRVNGNGNGTSPADSAPFEQAAEAAA